MAEQDINQFLEGDGVDTEREKIIILGGGPTTATVRDYVGADAWTLNPKEGVDWCKDFVQKL